MAEVKVLFWQVEVQRQLGSHQEFLSHDCLLLIDSEIEVSVRSFASQQSQNTSCFVSAEYPSHMTPYVAAFKAVWDLCLTEGGREGSTLRIVDERVYCAAGIKYRKPIASYCKHWSNLRCIFSKIERTFARSLGLSLSFKSPYLCWSRVLPASFFIRWNSCNARWVLLRTSLVNDLSLFTNLLFSVVWLNLF